MFRLLADEHINKDIVRGAKEREPTLDFLRLIEVSLQGANDERILEWCAGEDRVLVSKDHNSLIGFAFERVKAGLAMPGVLMLKEPVGIGEAIEAILLAALATTPEEWKDRVQFLP